jgi:hypothetical protein
VSFLNSSQFLSIAAASTLVLAIGVLFGFWLRRSQHPLQTNGEKMAAWGIGFTSISWLLFFAALAAFMSSVAVPEPELLVRYPTSPAWAMHITATLAATLSLVSTAGLFPVWRSGSWPIGRRLRHTVVVLASLSLVWALDVWNILGFRWLG